MRIFKPTMWAFLIILATVMAVPVQAADDTPAVYISYTTASDNHTHVGGVYWSAQTFLTDNNTSISATAISISLLRNGAPGNVTVALRKTVAGVPTGDNLVSGILVGGTMDTVEHWEKFTLTSEYTLETNTSYAIVMSAPTGDNTTNSMQWMKKTVGTYTGGTEYVSTDSGVTWGISSPSTCDFRFQVWGKHSMLLQDVKVFQSYRQTDDWLITVRYLNIAAPYYDTYDVRKYFVLQLLDDTGVVKAQTAVPSWGNRVGSIYLSAAQAAPLTYGVGYSVRMQGIADNSSVSYSLLGTDWLGSDLANLDSWVLTSSTVIGTYYATTMTTYIAERGEVLNSTGAGVFSAGIAGLSTVRPEIFQTYTVPSAYVPGTITQAGRAAIPAWQTNVGPDATVMLTRVGNIVGIGGDIIAIIAFLIMMFVLMALAFPAGNTTAAMVLSLPMLGAAIWFGMDLLYIGMLALVAAFLLIKNFWLDKGN